MATWVKSITSPFKKACKPCIFPNHHQAREKKPKEQGHDVERVMDLHGEVMACAYEDVQVMWSIMLDKSNPRPCNVTS